MRVIYRSLGATVSHTAIAKIGDDDESDERRMHPLSRLTAGEIIQTRHILADNSLAEASVRFAYVGLEEPAKADVLNHQPATPADRRVRVISFDTNSGVHIPSASP
jgi:Cu2+-containing amine oxidase